MRSDLKQVFLGIGITLAAFAVFVAIGEIIIGLWMP